MAWNQLLVDTYKQLRDKNILKGTRLNPMSVESYNGAVVNKFFHSHYGATTTLTVATLGDGTEYQITIASTVGFSVGDYVHIEDTNSESTDAKILSIVGSVLTLDRIIDFAHDIGTIVEQTTIDISSAVGSHASPLEYYVQPPANEKWNIHRILFEMQHSTAGDLGLFGNLTPLTNGVILRAEINGTYYTFTNWKDNGEIKADMFDVEFDTRSGGGGVYGTTGRGTFRNAGSVVVLDGSTNDKLEVYVRDDITALTRFTIKAQGHKV